jgi:TetR/AcrR family transcriptional regulator, mexJK operon transcriptional repressor
MSGTFFWTGQPVCHYRAKPVLGLGSIVRRPLVWRGRVRSVTGVRTISKSVAIANRAEASPARGKSLRGRGRPRRGQADQLDDELLERALEHFLERGFEGATLNAITASLGMSKQTVYARYSDKTMLFRASLKRAIDAWLIPLEGLPGLEGENLERTLLDVARLIVTTLMSPAGQQLIRITNAESYRMPEIGAYAYQHGQERIAAYLVDLFERRLLGVEDRWPNLHDLATTFLNLLSGPARRSAWGIEETDIDLETFVRQQVHLFLHGVRPAAAD